MNKMKNQKDAFLEGEGDGWYVRNRVTSDNLQEKRDRDPPLKILSQMNLSKATILEIGSSNGWRLTVLKEKFPNARLFGIDPSAQAVAEAPPGVKLQLGSADSLPFDDQSFDLVIFGFCLYLCDRRDLFKIAAEADRVVRDGGHIMTYDFHTPQAYKNPYAHQTGLFSYKMDYSLLFSWNPAYRVIKDHVQPHPGKTDNTPDNRVGVVLLQKNLAAGWPDNPYK